VSQTFPQPPQFFGSTAGSTQVSPHEIDGGGHAHDPLPQI
jgi:hypothetical protein